MKLILIYLNNEDNNYIYYINLNLNTYIYAQDTYSEPFIIKGTLEYTKNPLKCKYKI